MDGTSNKTTILSPSMQLVLQSIHSCSEAKLVAWFSCWIVTEEIPEEGECYVGSICVAAFHRKGLCRFGLWLKDVPCLEFSSPTAVTSLAGSSWVTVDVGSSPLSAALSHHC